MKKLKACGEKLLLWRSLPDLDIEAWSEAQWKEVIEHTRICKKCRSEIIKVAAWSENQLTSDAVIEIYHEDIIPGVLGQKPSRHLTENQRSARCLIINAVNLFNEETEPQTAWTKINEYLFQKHCELKLPMLKVRA